MLISVIKCLLSLPEQRLVSSHTKYQVTHRSNAYNNLAIPENRHFCKETARSQERLELRATNSHQTMSQWLLFAKNRESSQSNRLWYLHLKFASKLTSASTEFATTNGDRSTELTETFLLVYRYLDLIMVKFLIEVKTVRNR